MASFLASSATAILKPSSQTPSSVTGINIYWSSTLELFSSSGKNVKHMFALRDTMDLAKFGGPHASFFAAEEPALHSFLMTGGSSFPANIKNNAFLSGVRVLQGHSVLMPVLASFAATVRAQYSTNLLILRRRRSTSLNPLMAYTCSACTRRRL